MVCTASQNQKKSNSNLYLVIDLECKTKQPAASTSNDFTVMETRMNCEGPTRESETDKSGELDDCMPYDH